MQIGFGWTNGVILELLDRYGPKLRAVDRFDDAIERESIMVTGIPNIMKGGAETRTFITALLVITISLAVGIIG